MPATLTFSGQMEGTNNMGTNKWASDWKFWVQLGVILISIGYGMNANSNMQEKVRQLEKTKDDMRDTLLRMEGKFDLLQEQIKQLKERLEARKVVLGAGDSWETIAGEQYIERRK